MPGAEEGRPRSGNLIQAGGRSRVLWPHQRPQGPARVRGEWGAGRDKGWERPTEHRRRPGSSNPALGSGPDPSLPPSQLTGQGTASVQGRGTETQQRVLSKEYSRGDPCPGRTPASPTLPEASLPQTRPRPALPSQGASEERRAMAEGEALGQPYRHVY